MNHLIPRPFRIREADITGRNFLASPEIPYVRAEAETIGAKAVRFSVTSSSEVGRDFVSRAMTYPLQETDDWAQVERGLRESAYLSRAIRKLHGSVPAKARLSSLKPASVELADILKATKTTDELHKFLKMWWNQPDIRTNDLAVFLQAWRSRDRNVEVPTVNEEYAANIPVFTNAEAIRHTEDSLLVAAPQSVAQLLRGYVDDPETIRALALLSAPYGEKDAMPVLSEAERYTIQNAVMRDEARRGWIEAVHETLDRQFVAVKEEAKLEGQVVSGGGYDSTVYIRRGDIPEHLQEKEGDIRILVGSMLRDPERESGLPRHRVKFIRRKQITVAHPRVVWVNNNGVRHFEYPSGQNEPSFLRPIIARPNSLVGAAIFANLIGMTDCGIEYGKALDTLIGRRNKNATPLARAGMLGLVLHTKQNELLSHPYFEMIEERAVQ